MKANEVIMKVEQNEKWDMACKYKEMQLTIMSKQIQLQGKANDLPTCLWLVALTKSSSFDVGLEKRPINW